MVKEPIAWLQLGAARLAFALHIDRPGVERLLADIEGDAYFAGRSVAMPPQHVAVFIHPKIRIGRQQPQSALVLHTRPQIFEQAVECGVAAVAGRHRHLLIGPQQSACKLGMGIRPEKRTQRRIEQFRDNEVSLVRKKVAGSTSRKTSKP